MLGTSFFGAYLLSFNQIGGGLPLWWIQVADLPMILSALVYGGSSLYVSMVKPGNKSYGLFLIIAVPLTLLFLFFAVFNFWEVLGLPAGQS